VNERCEDENCRGNICKSDRGGGFRRKVGLRDMAGVTADARSCAAMPDHEWPGRRNDDRIDEQFHCGHAVHEAHVFPDFPRSRTNPFFTTAN